MNDVERELRELLERKAGSVGGVAPRLPETVRKRGRRRQAGTAAVSAFTVAAVALVSFAGLRAIDRGEADGRVPADDPWAGYEVFKRTATIENFTITSPSDWYLVNQWPLSRQIAVTGATVSCSGSSAPTPAAGATGGGPPPTSTDCETSSPEPLGPEVLPVLSLSNTDLGLTTSPCLSGDVLVGDTDAVMTIAFDSSYFGANFGSGDRQRWPIPFETPSADDRRSCGPGTYVYFASDDLPYVAHFAFGERVQDDERRTLIQAFESMRVKSSPDFNPPPTVQPTSGAYVIAGGENAAGPWSLEIRPSTSSGSGANVDLLLVTAEGPGVGMADVTVPGERAIEQAGGDPTFGVVTKEADSVVLRQESRLSPIPAQLIPLPPSLPFDFDIFVARNEMDMPAEAVAVGVQGQELGRADASAPVEASRASVVASGETLGTAWTLRFDGSPGRNRIELVDAQGNVLAELDPRRFYALASSGLEHSSFTFSSGDRHVAVVFGAAAPAATELAIALVTGERSALRAGDPRWDPLPVLTSTDRAALRLWWFETTTGHGQLATFNESCDRLAKTLLETDTPVPSLPTPPPVVEPTCGGGVLD